MLIATALLVLISGGHFEDFSFKKLRADVLRADVEKKGLTVVIIDAVTNFFKDIKAVAKTKSVSDITQTKTNIVANTFTLGVVAIAATALPVVTWWMALIAVGALLFVQYGVPAFFYKDVDSVSTKTFLTTAGVTLAMIIPALILLKVGILTLPVIGVFLGALIPFMLMTGIFGAFRFWKKTSYIKKPLEEISGKKASGFKDIAKIATPVAAMGASVLLGVIKGGTISAAISAIAAATSLKVAALGVAGVLFSSEAALLSAFGLTSLTSLGIGLFPNY